jgi:hypothetical protein
MPEKKAQFLPFHAINEFMRPDFRLEVIRTVLNALPNLPDRVRESIDRYTKKYIQVQGFRNSSKSPASVRVKPTAEAFERRPDLVAAILSAWAEVHPVLSQQVFDLLTARNWEVLPPDADRTKLPGFLTSWPQGEDFDILNTAYQEMYPDVEPVGDDVSLMVVWLSGRLPYQVEADEN